MQTRLVVSSSSTGRLLALAFLLSAVAVAGVVAQAPIRWLRVGADNEVVALNRWNAGVGPPFVVANPQAGGTTTVLVVVSWNCTHFTNMVLHHLFVLSESGRLRQARARACCPLTAR